MSDGAARDSATGPSLCTERLRLVPYAPSHLEILHALWTHPAVRRYLFDDEIVSRRWVRDEIEAVVRSFHTSGIGQWLLFERGRADEAVGFAGLRPFRGSEVPQLLYGLAPHARGRGLATEAAAAVVSYAFERLGFAHVVASTDEPNRASVAVMQRLGMTPVEPLPVDGRATLFFAIVRETWERRNHLARGS